MIGNKKTTNNGDVTITYTRENWKEWFRYFGVIYECGEWEVYPKFYLPVSRDYAKNGYTFWIMPLAPFALIFIALTRASKQFWFDLVDCIDKWKRKALPTNKIK